mmetsp:Transcript_10596/g.16968  ORF Transcript_10596/g.16968 Transcript_10596/m.16968 type:complete len:238 (+) Transcript_10596:619-1332(+)
METVWQMLPGEMLQLVIERALPAMAPVVVFRLSEQSRALRRLTARWRWKLWGAHQVAARLTQDQQYGTMWHSLLLRDDGDEVGADRTLVHLMLLAELHSWAKSTVMWFKFTPRLTLREKRLYQDISEANSATENLLFWCHRGHDRQTQEVGCVAFVHGFGAGEGCVGTVRIKLGFDMNTYPDQYPTLLSVWIVSERAWHPIIVRELSSGTWTSVTKVSPSGVECTVDGAEQLLPQQI